MTVGIYVLTNAANGKRYVGSATCIHQRWNEHRSMLARGKHHSRYLQAAWLKYGAESFRFETLLQCAPEHLLLYEQRAIDVLQPAYNIARIAGNTLGCGRSPETRAKIGAKLRGRKRDPALVEQIASKLRGRKMSPEHVAHLIGNQHAKGLVHTEEWKAANSARNKGKARPKSPEVRAKIAAALRGRKATPQARAHQAAAQMGKKRGPYKRAAQ